MNVFFYVTYVALWLLVVVLSLGLVALYHHFGEMYASSPQGRARQGQASGDFVRAMDSFTVHGSPALIPSGNPTVMVFVSTACSVCHAVRDVLPDAATRLPEVDFVVLCAGRRPLVEEWSRGLPEAIKVVPDPRGRLSQHFNVDVTPFAMSVGSDGRVRSSGLVNDLDGILEAASDARSEPLPLVSSDPADQHASEDLVRGPRS